MIRIGAINYLNSLPLIRGIEEEPGDIDLCFEVPSRLATHLRAGLLDLALVPQVEACRDPDYRVVPEICIASGGSVDSILLFARRPIEQIERVGTDAGSHTSVELLKVLFHARWGRIPRCVPVAPTLDELRAGDPSLDGVLLIGDRALAEDRGEFPRHDLAEMWHEDTGHPFVFAVWLGREGLDPIAIAAVRRAAARGLQALPEIAAEFAGGHPAVIDEASALVYLSERIEYRLGPAEIESMLLFHQLRAAIGTVDNPRWRPRFFEVPP